MTFTPVDGKYCSYNYLLQYIQGQRTDPNNPSVFNGAVQGTPDQEIIDECLLQAEALFERETGSNFNQATETLVEMFAPFIDQNGWVWGFARERGPVTAVTAAQILNVYAGSTTWTDLTIDPNLVILPPVSTTHVRPESWRVLFKPTPAQAPAAQGQIYVKWTYQGGFSVIPDSLTNLIARMAAYLYKLREAPIGRVVNGPFGQMTVPQIWPADLQRQIVDWRPVYD